MPKTTIYLGDKARELFGKLAEENEMAMRYFLTKIIIREAKAEAPMLTADKLKERLLLIDEVNDEFVELLNNPPKYQLSREYSTDPKRIYQRVWEAHRRLRKRGMSDDAIHDYCLAQFGIDFDIKKTPTKSPKRNPEWVGGGRVAKKLKEAKRVSEELSGEGTA